MKNPKKIGLVLALSFSLFTGFLFASPTAKASADEIKDLSQICVPAYGDAGNGHHVVTGWLKATFIDRAHIQATYYAVGNCATPSSNSSDVFFGNRTFAQIFKDISGKDGTLLLNDNVADGNISYNAPVGNSGKDDTRIDQFSGSLDGLMKDDLGGHDKIVDSNQLNNYIKNAEITLGLEGSKVGYSCSDINGNDTANNFVLVDASTPKWICSSGDIGSQKGFVVGIENFLDLEKFNTTYSTSIQGDAIIIKSVYDSESNRTFSWCSGPGKFVNDNCQGKLTLNATKDQINSLGGDRGRFTIKDSSGKSVEVFVAGANTTVSDIANGSGGTSGGNGSAGDACFGSGWGLAWLFCPLVEASSSLANSLIGVFEGQLSFTVNDLSNHDGQNSLKKAWTIFKDISSAMFVILMLVIVLSEAISFGPFDAYTVRKMLPRLIIAVIFMQLSWALLSYVVNVVNDIGIGLADIMYLPFGGTKAMSFDALLHNAGVSQLGGSVAGWGGLIAGAAFAAFAPFTVLIGAFSAIVSLLVGLATLIFRKILIMLALVFAPVAFAAWVLPGTKKYYDMWYSNFTKSLMMFPLAVALIAAGRIFAYVSGTQTSALLGFFIVLVGFFGPLFILPKSYKWGGALMTSAGNGIQGAAKKMSESPRKFLDNRREGWRAERQRQSQERFNKEEGFDPKKLSSYWNTPLDKMRAGKWDPTLGRGRKLRQKRDENGELMYEKDKDGRNILTQPVMEIVRDQSRRRQQKMDNYALKGAESEEADVKAANARVGLKIDRLVPDDQDEYARQLAAGFNTSLDAHGRLIRIDPSLDEDDEKVKETLYDPITGLNRNIQHDSPSSLTEQRAGLDTATRLGGEGNLDHVLKAFERITNMPEGTEEERKHKTEAIEMMNKFKTANAPTLFKKLAFIYKNPDFAMKGHINEGNVDRTIEGMGAEDITTSSGVGTRAMMSALLKRINGEIPGKPPGDAAKAQKVLDRLRQLNQEAKDDVTLRGRIPPDVSRAFTNLEAGRPLDSKESAESVRGNDATPAHPDAVAPVGGRTGVTANNANPGLGGMLAQGESASIHGAPIGTVVEARLDHEALGQTLTQSFREALRTSHMEGGVGLPGSPGTVHMPDGSEHTVPPPPPPPEPGPRIIRPGDPDFHNPTPGE